MSLRISLQNLWPQQIVPGPDGISKSAHSPALVSLTKFGILFSSAWIVRIEIPARRTIDSNVFLMSPFLGYDVNKTIRINVTPFLESGNEKLFPLLRFFKSPPD